MTLDELMALFARNNGIDKPKLVEGRYLLAMEGADVYCYEEIGKVYLLSELGALSKSQGQRQSDTKLLLDKSMGLIRDQRSSLTLDEEKGVYLLYQRMPLDSLRIDMLQEAVESFGGCCLYYQSLLGQSSGGASFSPSDNMMMP